MINNREKNNIAREIYEDLIVKPKEEIIDICSSQMYVIYKKEREIKKLHFIIKEVRECINEKLNINSDYVDYDFGTELLRHELLEILDKVKENTNGKD